MPSTSPKRSQPTPKTKAKATPKAKGKAKDDATTRILGTRAYEFAQTKPVWCAGPCGLPIMGSRLRYELAVAVEVWHNAKGKLLPPGKPADQDRGDRWVERKVFHVSCYDGEYGPAEPMTSSTPVKSRI